VSPRKHFVLIIVLGIIVWKIIQLFLKLIIVSLGIIVFKKILSIMQHTVHTGNLSSINSGHSLLSNKSSDDINNLGNTSNQKL
jgi:hypothetical protein